MKKVNSTTVYVAIAMLLIGLLLGWKFLGNEEHTPTANVSEAASLEEEVWTCSMHPQIRQSEPGKCPLCGMDLILVSNSSSKSNPMAIKMSESAMQLADIQTAVVGKGIAEKAALMNGKIKVDGRSVRSQASHFSGRIEKLLVNTVGEQVYKGQKVAEIYSPALATAQQELFEAYKMRETHPSLYQAARDKLLNWKLTEPQIDEILKDGKPRDRFTILADASGIVLHNRVNTGDYIQKGQSLFELSDLSRIWVLFDVYESELLWIRKGDRVSFTAPSFPGEAFAGKISFIDPIIDPKTRIASARVELANPKGKLKPEMFVQGRVNSKGASKLEEIIVPKTAVMWTGERSVVYVKEASVNGIEFLLREVVLGPSLGKSYVIKSGLEVGDEIAVNGTFSIDAAAQLAGKPSMMNPEGGAVMLGHNHGGSKKTTSEGSASQPASHLKAKSEVQGLFDIYLSLKDHLATDDFAKSQGNAMELEMRLGKIKMSIFEGESHLVWMNLQEELKHSIEAYRKAKDITDARLKFEPLSKTFIRLATEFGPLEKSLYIQHCPMANGNEGANWISISPKISNPYFGAAMLGCGETIKTIEK